jgi:hypothetical protein
VGIAKIHTARSRLASVVQAGYFVPTRTTSFEFLYRFDSVAAWLAYMSERWSDATIDPGIPSRARRLLRRATRELVICEQIRATRLERQSKPPEPPAT